MSSVDDNSELEFLTAMGTLQSSSGCPEDINTPMKSTPPIESIEAKASVESTDMLSPILIDNIYSGFDEYSRSLNHQLSHINMRIDGFINSALVFVKPHANTSQVRNFVRTRLLEQINSLGDDEGQIVFEFDVNSHHIKKGRLVDKHYRSLSVNAVNVPGIDANIPDVRFKSYFGEDLHKVKNEERIFNAREALTALACTPERLEEAWVQVEMNSSKGKIKKFGNGLLCANMVMNGENIYVINGFYMAMRGRYIAKNASIHAYIVQWNQKTLSWKDFSFNVIGSTNPSQSGEKSIRRYIYENHELLGLQSQPDIINNVIHASASPLEGLVERCNWCSRGISEDKYGRLLLGRGIPESVLIDWCGNIKVKVPISGDEDHYKLEHVFDIVEGEDANECTEKLIGVYDHDLFGSIVSTKWHRCLKNIICSIPWPQRRRKK